MKTIVRFYSKNDNTKLLAKTIASTLSVEEISILEDDNRFEKNLDVLFLGSSFTGLFNGSIKKYIEKLPIKKYKVILFSSSLFSKYVVKKMKKLLNDKGIIVLDEFINYSSKLSLDNINDAKEKVKMLVKKI